jgi:hypothetical protein
MAEDLKVVINKEKSWRNVANDMDKILTVLSNTIKLDLSDPSEYPTISVTGEFSDDYGIVALSCEKLQTARKISLTGDATGSITFDGSNDVEIKVSVTNISNTPITQVFTTDGEAKKAVWVTDNIGKSTAYSNGVPISKLFESDSNGITDRYAALLSVSTLNLRYGSTNYDVSQLFDFDHLVNGVPPVKYSTSLATTSGTKFDTTDVAIKSGNNTFSGSNTFTNTNTIANTLYIGNTSGSGSLVFRNTTNSNGTLNVGSSNPTATDRLNYNGYLYATAFSVGGNVLISNNSSNIGGTNNLYINGYVHATRVYNAVYNADYAECFEPIPHFRYLDNLHRIVEIVDGKIQLASEYSKSVVGIISDNYGYVLGGEIEEIENSTKIPVGLSGVLFVDAENKVSKKDLYKFIVSAGEGKARPLNSYENILHFGEMVGKIIGIDEENNRYKILLAIR